QISSSFGSVSGKTPLKLIVVSTSPRDEACAFIGRELIKAASKEAKRVLQPFKGELLLVGNTGLQLCDRCDLCLDPKWRNESNRYCKLEDGLEEWYPKLEACDGIILIAPSYVHSLSGLCVGFTDRLRPILKSIRNGSKCCQAVGVGGSRYGGQGAMVMELKDLLAGTWAVPITSLVYPGGADVWSGYKFKKDENKYGSGWQGAKDHKQGMIEIHEMGKQMIQGMRLIKAGRKALNLD
ncbi:MAG: NAD(P)H-dependent oxidoreductase, partial [Candidatus Ranarchaeia archaeon]